MSKVVPSRAAKLSPTLRPAPAISNVPTPVLLSTTLEWVTSELHTLPVRVRWPDADDTLIALFVALKAILLTVILDDGSESVEWELDAGDWVLVRVSDYADLAGRGRGDLFPANGGA